jgi:hypothetical protein
VTGPSAEAELQRVRAAIDALHWRQPDSPHCAADGEPWPCPTRRVAGLHGPAPSVERARGDCQVCGMPPAAWCPGCAKCACADEHDKTCPETTR